MATKKKPEASAPEAAALPENCQPGKVGKGWRFCPRCEHSTKGGRTKVCANPACGFEFPAATPSTSTSTITSTRKASASTSFSDMLETIRKLKDFNSEAGGVDEAEKWIAEIETLAAECGGMDELKKAIRTVEEM